MNKIETINAGIFGTVVGDALGEPVEFTSRAARKVDPVADMRGHGTHDQPQGTWSDDSSMMLATLDSIILRGGIRYSFNPAHGIHFFNSAKTIANWIR